MSLCSVAMFSILLLIILVGQCQYDQVSAQQKQLFREKRYLYFPPDDGVGVGAALAIPLDNGRGDVFVSYCIESNYVHPTYSVKELALDPPPFGPFINGDTVEDRHLDAGAEIFTTTTTIPTDVRKDETEKVENVPVKQEEATAHKSPTAKRKMRNSFISRTKFYQMVENKMIQHGLNAKKCLLRAICEANLYELGAHNGVLGDFIHVLFSPSTSKDENLPKKYYMAEQRGRDGESCEKAYGKECQDGIFDLITIIK